MVERMNTGISGIGCVHIDLDARSDSGPFFDIAFEGTLTHLKNASGRLVV
jgi:hypothetical protein